MLVLAAITAALLAAPVSATAATITVTTSSDVAPGQCTLRKAIVAANTDAFTDGCPAGSPGPGGDTIQFTAGVGGTILAGSPLPVVVGNLAVVGPGAGALTISGGDAVSLFQIEEPAVVTISGLTIAHARCAFACGLKNSGTSTLERVVVEGNVAVAEGGSSTFPQAGGIFNQGSLTLVESTVVANRVIGAGGSSQNSPQGGGLYNASAGTLSLERSTVSENSAEATSGGAGTTNAGGAGISNRGVLVLRQSTVSGNVATAVGSTVANTAGGGGVSNANAPSVDVTIDRSTIAGNSAVATGAGTTARGGGAVVFGTSFTVHSSTIAGNSAPIGANLTGGALAKLSNTIVADPLGGGLNCESPVTSAGYNLESGGSCGFGKATDKPSTDPLLVPGGPTNNGGPTPTIALLEGSPAIDAGLGAVGEAVDQRGLTRPVQVPGVADAAGGDGTDIGAFEVQVPTPPVTPVEPVGPGAPVPPVDTGTPGATPSGDAPGTPGPSVPRDTVAPTVTITALPANGTARRLRIRFGSSEPGSTFRCKLDHQPYRPCRSPFKTKRLELGRHRFAVIATDPGGNASKPATKKFRISAAG